VIICFRSKHGDGADTAARTWCFMNIYSISLNTLESGTSPQN